MGVGWCWVGEEGVEEVRAQQAQQGGQGYKGMSLWWWAHTGVGGCSCRGCLCLHVLWRGGVAVSWEAGAATLKSQG